MKPKQLNRIRIELLAKLAEYGVEWDVYSEKLIANDLKLMQKQLAQHTNLGGLKYENKFIYDSYKFWYLMSIRCRSRTTNHIFFRPT